MVGSYTEAPGKSKRVWSEIKFCDSCDSCQNTFPVNRVGLLKVDLKEKELQVWTKLILLKSAPDLEVLVFVGISFENLQDLVVLQTRPLSWKLKF